MEKLDKVIAGLERCCGCSGEDNPCKTCPYAEYEVCCLDVVREDALAAIKDLQERLKMAKDGRLELGRRCRELEDKLAAVEAERDDLRKDIEVLTESLNDAQDVIKRQGKSLRVVWLQRKQAWDKLARITGEREAAWLEQERPDEWRDNCDSYRCPRCGFEKDNPNRLEDYGVRCPRCGKQLRWVIPEVADGNN